MRPKREFVRSRQSNACGVDVSYGTTHKYERYIQLLVVLLQLLVENPRLLFVQLVELRAEHGSSLGNFDFSDLITGLTGRGSREARYWENHNSLFAVLICRFSHSASR